MTVETFTNFFSMIFFYYRQFLIILIIIHFAIDLYDYQKTPTYLFWICNLDLIDPDDSLKSPISNPLINPIIITCELCTTKTGNEVAIMFFYHTDTSTHLNRKQVYVA